MKKLVVLTGAGMSAESGISTFRDSDGLWMNYRVEDVATPEGFIKNPQMVLDFYNARRREVMQTKPNAGHLGLAALEPYFDVRIVTQNIDNLHERAGSTKVLHLHGEVMKACTMQDKETTYDLSPEHPDIHIGGGSGGRHRSFTRTPRHPFGRQGRQRASTASLYCLVWRSGTDDRAGYRLGAGVGHRGGDRPLLECLPSGRIAQLCAQRPTHLFD